MTEPVTRLPDCDSIKGMSVLGEIVEVQYEQAVRGWFALTMTMTNALFLLSLLSNLPGADQTLQRAREFRQQNPSGPETG